MDADDLGRMLGWEFSLMVATVRIINSGLLDELPTLKLQFSHFAGGLARYLPRIRGLQSRSRARGSFALLTIPRRRFIGRIDIDKEQPRPKIARRIQASRR